MANLAVLLYEHTTNPLGVPTVWPAEVRELGESVTLPGVNWLLMTVGEYNAYLDLHRATYLVWYAAYLAIPVPADNQTISIASSTTTTSASDILLNGMTTTPLPGTYKVTFSGTLQSNSNNSKIYVSIYAGGSQIAGTERVETPQFQSGLSASLSITTSTATDCLATVDGTQAIEVRWRRDGGVAVSLARTLTVVKV